MRYLTLGAALALALTGSVGSAQTWTRSWYAAPDVAIGVELTDRTIRQVVRVSSGGERFRLRLSNELSDAALRVGAVHVALAGADGAIVAGSDHVVTFAGARGASIAPRAPIVSDAIVMRVAPSARLAISIHLPEGATRPTVHNFAGATGWIVAGDRTAAATLEGATKITRRIILAGVEMDAGRRARTIVTFGDSITDGALSTIDADVRWPDLLARRMGRSVGIANAGIGGNRLLRNDTGPSALARFDRDVLAVPGVSHVVVLEGINDIGMSKITKTPLGPDALIGGYRQLIARAHDRGVKIVFGTILPYGGAFYSSEAGEATRIAANRWIRDNREADGVIDFDRAIADPAAPAKMAAAYDSGDHLHPNDAGYRAMAAAIDTALLR